MLFTLSIYEAISARAVNGDEDLLVVTNKGIIIRISLSQIKVSSRNTQGVRIIKLLDDQRVSSMEVVEAQIEEETEELIENENTENVENN